MRLGSIPPSRQGTDSRPWRAAIPYVAAGLLGLLLCGLFPPNAVAGIGGLRPQVMADARRMGLSLVRTDQRSGYSALTFKRAERSSTGAPTGSLLVREFLDQTGRSFGVAWKGSLRPDLSTLLGPLASHLPRVNRSPDRHRLYFQDGHLEISVVGTPRFQAGQAIDLRHLPPGVTKNEIRIAQ